MILEKPFYPENHISSYRIDWKRHQLNQNEVPFRLVWNYVGILAASFTTTMFTANRVIEISLAQRSLYMLLGGAVIVFSFSVAHKPPHITLIIFLKWELFWPFWHHNSSHAYECRLSSNGNRTWKHCFGIRASCFRNDGLFPLRKS
jgi:hypothetical protein